MVKASSEEAPELIDNVSWSLQYEDYIDQLNRRAEEVAEEQRLTPQELLERGEVQQSRLYDIFSREVKRVRLQVQGHTRTNTSFLVGEFDFSQVNTIADACEKAQIGVQNIESFGILNQANIMIDTSDDPGVLDVTINLKEVDRLDTLEVKTEHTSSEVSANVGWKIRNVLGNGETIRATGSLGTEPSIGIGSSFLGRTSSSVNLDFFKPRAFGTKATINFNFFKTLRNRSINSSYLVHAHGLNATYTSPCRNHTLTYGVEQRASFRNPGKGMYKGFSENIIEESFPIMKSFLRYTFNRDTRDNRVIPTEGYQLSASAELAGFGGDVQFVKAETAASYHRPLKNLCTINFGMRGGLIVPLGSIFSGVFSDVKTRICDRIPCGGALISRGWQQGAIGPKDDCDYLNGELCASAGVSATGPIPDSPLFWHGFLGGTSGSLHSETTPGSSILSTVLKRARVSAGVSLVYPLSTGRLEIGLAQSVNGDNIDPFYRIFWGFGIHFL